jgi:hypothetical protein
MAEALSGQTGGYVKVLAGALTVVAVSSSWRCLASSIGVQPSKRSPDTANALNQLGLVHLGSGDVEGAWALFGRALDVAERIASRNAQTVKALDNIAAAHRARGATAVAEVLPATPSGSRAPSTQPDL